VKADHASAAWINKKKAFITELGQDDVAFTAGQGDKTRFLFIEYIVPLF
jgi:hypothetical protein